MAMCLFFMSLPCRHSCKKLSILGQFLHIFYNQFLTFFSPFLAHFWTKIGPKGSKMKNISYYFFQGRANFQRKSLSPKQQKSESEKEKK